MSTFIPMAMIYSLHLDDLIILDIMIDMRQAVIFDVERDAVLQPRLSRLHQLLRKRAVK